MHVPEVMVSHLKPVPDRTAAKPRGSDLRILPLVVLVATFAAAFGVDTAGASIITFAGQSTNLISGQAVAASANWQWDGGDLLLTLANEGDDALVPTDILTAVFFDIAGNPDLSALSATLAGASEVRYGTTDAGAGVGGEWSYRNGLSGAPGGQRMGVSSSGYGLFGAGNFPGTNLQGPVSVNGLQYGLTSWNDDPATGNAALKGKNALIRASVLFRFGNLPAGFDLEDISNVGFQYGTSLTEGAPYLVGELQEEPGGPPPAEAAEPSTLLLMTGGVAALLRAERRRRRG